MRAAPSVSRRGLFSLGAARLIPGREEVAALGEAMRGYREAESGAETPVYAVLTERARAEWSEGDYRETAARLAPAAQELLAAAGVTPDQSVLDVGAGDGNVALAAAARGAKVTALDLSPKLVAQGRARCERAGAVVAWEVGDAQRLPFPDDAFDCVLSSFGAMFAPYARIAAAELARVARPGGVVAMANWSSTGFMGRVLDVAAKLRPLPQTVPQPSRWGRYESAFLWLGPVTDDFQMSRRRLPLRFADPGAAWDELSTEPGPLAGALAGASAERREEARGRVLELAAAAGGFAGYVIVSGRALPVNPA